MKKAAAKASVAILAALVVIVAMQYLLLKKTIRFNTGLEKLTEQLTQSDSQPKMQPQSSAKQFEQYPGDSGDWLIWAFAVEPKTLNQINVNRDIYSRWMTVPTVFEPLLDYSYDEVKLKPHLAQSYHISDDGMELTFRLRDDVHFSDGVPISANDVIFTYETITNPLIDAADLAQLYVDVNHVEKIDELTVKFYMDQPYFKALEILSFWDVGIYPKHIYDFNDPAEFNARISNPVGSGPYLFEKWISGQQVSFVRNENYWGPKPKIERVVYKFITNDQARLQALRTGKVDFIIPSPDQFAEVCNDEQFTQKFRCLSYWNPGVPFFYIGWNQKREIFKDRLVRLAMTHIIDRDRIVAHLLKGIGRVVTGPSFIDSPQTDPNIEPWPYDPQRAKQLLAQAGWADSDGDGILDKDGKKMSFEFAFSADSSLYRMLAKLFRDEAEQIGVEVITDPVEWSVLLPRLVDHDYDSMVMGWGGDIIEDHYQLFHSSQIENRGSNYVSFSNPRADKLLEQIRRTMDEKKRTELSRELHRILHRQQPYTFLFTRPTLRLLDKRFENVIIHKLGVKEEQWYVPLEKQKYSDHD